MSHVKALRRNNPALHKFWRVSMRMIVQRWERSPETSVNILLFAFTHVRFSVWGCPGLSTGVDLAAGLTG
jgi:hypothetical protein